MVLALMAAYASDVFANGTPVKIPLTRLSGIVNFGPAQARGQAEITVVEGDVAVTVTGLERLPNALYQAWLVNTRTGERLSVGKFNVTQDGTAQVKSIVNLGNREFDLFVVTVEPDPDPSPEADQRIVLAGYWPGRAPAGAAATPGVPASTVEANLTAVPPGATVVSTAAPTNLPRTGGVGAGVLVGLVGLLAAGLWLVGRGAAR